jgi:ribonuclease P protein component
LLVLASPRSGTEELTRLGIVASRKVGGAVVRNRAKRLVREAFRLTSPRCPARWDLVVIVRASTVEASVEALSRELLRAFRSLPLAADALRSQADPTGPCTPPERS